MPTIAVLIRLARVDNWVKNAFCIPGLIAAIYFGHKIYPGTYLKIVVGGFAICIISSANYVINEIFDYNYDRFHPQKKSRPLVTGEVSILAAWVLFGVLTVLGLWLGFLLGPWVLAFLVALFVMGLIYNVPPVRSKELPYIDAITESVNNPIRLLFGWFIVVPHGFPTLSLIGSYWVLGAYFMELKRYAEFRFIKNAAIALKYRKSFLGANETSLLIVSAFYGNLFCLMFGSFIVKYRFELILAFPLYALFLAEYLRMALKEDSAAQYPELLYREKRIMILSLLCLIFTVFLLFYNMPWIYTAFKINKAYY